MKIKIHLITIFAALFSSCAPEDEMTKYHKNRHGDYTGWFHSYEAEKNRDNDPFWRDSGGYPRSLR